MKTLAILFAIVLVLGSCAVDKNLLTETEKINWSNRNDTIFYHNMPVAVFTHYEVELYRGRTDHEICLSALDIDTLNLEPDIIRYVHTKHPDDKVQFTPIYQEFKNKHKN
jgi:hypothetical protein